MQFFAFLFFCLTAPLMMSVAMIFICFFAGWKAFLHFPDSWCTMIFLMIFFGGLLVLFVYISTLAQNENLMPDLKRALVLTPILILILSDKFSFHKIWSFDYPQSVFLFNLNYFLLSATLISYLLLALVVVSKISFFHFGALREQSVNTFKENSSPY